MARGPSDTGLLGFLYGTAPGRLLLRPLTARWLSRLAGRFMDSRLSHPLIAPFIRKNGIEMGDYLPEQYPSSAIISISYSVRWRRRCASTS